jgi:hypothetical protein
LDSSGAAVDLSMPNIRITQKPGINIFFIVFSLILSIDFFDSTIHNNRIPADEKSPGAGAGKYGIKCGFLDMNAMRIIRTFCSCLKNLDSRPQSFCSQPMKLFLLTYSQVDMRGADWGA